MILLSTERMAGGEMKRPYWDTGDGFDHKLYDPISIKVRDYVVGGLACIFIVLASGI